MKTNIQRELSNLGQEQRKTLVRLSPELQTALFKKWEEHVTACARLSDCIPSSLADFISKSMLMDDIGKSKIWLEEKKRPEYEPAWHYDQYVGSKEK